MKLNRKAAYHSCTTSCCPQIVAVDKKKKQVTVQAGIRVQQLAEALAEHGLTLENFASIQEQQVGPETGFQLLHCDFRLDRIG
jgi:hypothetical protein